MQPGAGTRNADKITRLRPNQAASHVALRVWGGSWLARLGRGGARAVDLSPAAAVSTAALSAGKSAGSEPAGARPDVVKSGLRAAPGATRHARSRRHRSG